MTEDGYASIPGWATIIAHRDPDPYAYNRPDPVEVVFRFEPDDPEARGWYRFPEVEDDELLLTVGSGANPSRTWVADAGLLPGTRHRCERLEIGEGVGQPVMFRLTDVDTDSFPKPRGP